jgi:zinc protease
MSQQSNMGQAQQLGLFELLGGGWQNLGRFVDAVRRVTPADVQRVATRYMQHARFAVIGDPAKIDRQLFTSF